MPGVLTLPDPGPMARLREVIASPDTMGIIVQRITDADNPETLKEIAKAWQVPPGKLAEWITEDRTRAEQYANALRFAGEQAGHDVIRVADTATPENAAAVKVRVEARKWYAQRLARDRFGEAVEHKHSGSVSLLAVLSSMPKGARVIEAAPEKNSEKIISDAELII